MKTTLFLKIVLFLSCFGTIFNCFFTETAYELLGWMTAAAFAHYSLLVTLVNEPRKENKNDTEQTLDSNQ
jgi:hypothetical protein